MSLRCQLVFKGDDLVGTFPPGSPVKPGFRSVEVIDVDSFNRFKTAFETAAKELQELRRENEELRERLEGYEDEDGGLG